MMQEWTETKAIQDGIDRFLAGVKTDEIRQGMAHSLKTPGKRLRPLTLLLVAGLNGGAADRALNAALGMEFIHTASLIQDDIMDEGMKRRGELTSHEKFGLFVALVSADYLISGAVQLFAGYDEPSVRAFARAGQELSEGQVMDVKSRFVKASEEYYIECVRLKTASIFASCFEVGARVAGAGEARAQACFRMGEAFGIAYQIVDDLVEFTQVDDEHKKALQQSYILPLVYMETMSREGAIAACMAQVERRIAAIEQELAAFPDGEPKQKLRQVVDILRSYNGVRIQ